jgi:oligoribonuclease
MTAPADPRTRNRSSLPTGVAEASGAALGRGELLDGLPRHVLDGLHDELRDAVTAVHLERLGGIEVHEQHLELVAVPRVDEAGRVEARDAVLEGQAAAGLHEPGVARGQRERDARRHERPAAAGGQVRALAGHQVEAGVVRPGVGGEVELGVEAHDGDAQRLGHRDNVAIGRQYPAAVLVWMDLEMTGLDPARHVIVEIATLVTDDELEVVAEGPDLVVHQPPEALAEMDEVVRTRHGSSGLLTAIEASTITLEEAGRQTLEFIKAHVPEARAVPLCGNSIGTDRRFLAAQLPEIEEYLHYRSVDVSTLKELVRRWYPGALEAVPRKATAHRALDDIRESLTELRWYREHVFRTAGQVAAGPNGASADPAPEGTTPAEDRN